SGEPLSIIHRDVSPQNLIVGADGVTRVVDFGVAKAVGRFTTTTDGRIKGKIPYMAPEQIRSEAGDRRIDVFAAGIVLWETLTGKRLFAADNDGGTILNVLDKTVAPPGSMRADVPPEMDAVVLRALARDPAKRYATARDMAIALEASCTPATARRV